MVTNRKLYIMHDDAFKFAGKTAELLGVQDIELEPSYLPVQSQLPAKVDDTVLPPILSGGQFPKAYELTKRKVQIDGLFRHGDNVMLTAPSKMGKSWFFATMATAIASGQNFCDLATEKGKVLMIDLELHKDDAIDRLWRISQANGLDAPPDDLFLWSLRLCQYTMQTLTECLENRLSKMGKVDVIILDPIYLLEAGEFDENSATCVKNLMVELNKIGAQTGATICLSHHYRKGKMGNEDHIDRGSGSGAFARFPDSILSLSKHEENKCAILEVTGRSMPVRPPLTIEVDPPRIRRRADLPPVHKTYGKK